MPEYVCDKRLEIKSFLKSKTCPEAGDKLRMGSVVSVDFYEHYADNATSQSVCQPIYICFLRSLKIN